RESCGRGGWVGERFTSGGLSGRSRRLSRLQVKVSNTSRPRMFTGLRVLSSTNVVGAQEFWLRNLGIESDRLRTYFKRNNPSPRRRNVGREYHGIMRMRVKRSTGLNHRVSGWIQAVTRYCGVV